MPPVQVQDAEAFVSAVTNQPLALVGFFAAHSTVSRAARAAYVELAEKHAGIPVYEVDVKQVSTLHARLGVTAVPTVVRLKEGRAMNKVVGAQTAEAYERLLLAAAEPRSATGPDAAPSKHRIKVYVTDTCPWCTRVKSYLKQLGVSYSEVNVQRDESAAREMVRRSGQQGVPQLDIDGQMVVGFDKGRIDRLLGVTGS